MNIYVKGIKSSYYIEHLTRLFWKEANIDNGLHRKKGDLIYVRVSTFTGKILCCIKKDGKTKLYLEKHSGKSDNNEELLVKKLSTLVYKALVDFTGKTQEWGYLIGVRPVRIIHDLWGKGFTDNQIKDKFLNEFFVTEQKFNTVLKIASLQKKVLKIYNKNDFSLYVSIPFCPSRCSYCSFISRTIKDGEDFINTYVELLCKEIVYIKEIKEKFNLNLKTIYIGGGTPTALSAKQLKKLMAHIKNCFDISLLEEYTVEAGRPDCTDREKLQIIKDYGATRISINPQSFNDGVLKKIGRNHTGQDIIDCFNIAREIGHNNINMDLIAGLPGDTVDSFKKSVEITCKLNPENITVHTLTLKRASNIVIDNNKSEYDNTFEMLKLQDIITDNNYIPYYLYRQKNTLNNLENTSFCKEGFEGLYNIYIMEEVHTILSAGAGGVTKLRNIQQKQIERLFNYKYPVDYNKNEEKLIENYKKVGEFYGSYLDT